MSAAGPAPAELRDAQRRSGRRLAALALCLTAPVAALVGSAAGIATSIVASAAGVAPLAAPGDIELAGFAVLPAETFGPGPPSGQYGDDGRRAPAPRFAAQPVQGLSALLPGPRPGTWWGLSDNGYALRANSPDFRLVIHLFDARPDRREVRVLQRIELRDPAHHLPWRLAEENLPGRPLTGADVDPESFVAMPDGSFWVGDEIGPWLLHFGADGTLLAPPAELPADAAGALRSASHPAVLAGRERARLRSSRGFESLAPGPHGASTLVAMLEGSVEGDAPGVLRLYEFDPARGEWTGRGWRYRMRDPGHSVSELAYSGAGAHYLLLERDELQGDAARFKQVLALDLDAPTADGVATAQRVVDLLRIADPRRLGGGDATFRFPFWTPECLVVLDARTLLVVDDNNFPASGGRSATAPDPTEWIWLRARGRARFVR